MARGLPRREARKLQSIAHLQPVLDKISNGQVKEVMAEFLESEIDDGV